MNPHVRGLNLAPDEAPIQVLQLGLLQIIEHKKVRARDGFHCQVTISSKGKRQD